ncbi:MAG TPA: porin family protein [Saprospiraceae bacterium]|nr:porin family protein [Saprospiraceae bacterium]
MKNYVLLLSVILWGVNLSAQTVGFRIGSNTNNVRLQGLDSRLNPNTDFKSGFNGGIFMEFDLPENWSLSTGVNYNQKGFITSFNTSVNVGFELPIGASVHTNTNYVEVPLNLIHTFGTEKLGVYVTAGPSIGYASDAEAVAKTNSLIRLNVYRTDIDLSNDMINRWDLAGNIGAGVKVKLRSGYIHAGIGYQHSFSSGISAENIIDVRLRNSGVNTSIGYAYKF